jgi:hypothetical protein
MEMHESKSKDDGHNHMHLHEGRYDHCYGMNEEFATQIHCIMNESEIPYFDLDGRPEEERLGFANIPNIESSLLKNDYFSAEF